MNIVGQVPKIISAFTRSPEPHRDLVCQIVRATVQASFDLGMNLVTTALSGFPLPGFEVVLTKDMAINAEQFWRMWKLPKNKKVTPFKNPKFADWKDMKFHTYVDSLKSKNLPLPKHATAITFNPLGHVRGAIPGWLTRVFKERKHYATKSLSLEQGYDKGGMCSAFRGDEKDRSAGNIVKLTRSLSENMDDIRKVMRGAFRSISRGQIVVENVPSAFAMIVMNNKVSMLINITSLLPREKRVLWRTYSKDNLKQK